MSRDDFTQKTKETLAKRVGYLCSNPKCRRQTVGPNTSHDKSTSIGIAAHIHAASEGGPRNNSLMTVEERTSIENGIWLCSNCATIIDKDPNHYTPELLRFWKAQAEYESKSNLKGESPNEGIDFPALDFDLVHRTGIRRAVRPSSKNPIVIEESGRQVMDISKNPIYLWEFQWKLNFKILNNSQFPVYNITIESVGELHFEQLNKPPKKNNLPPLKILLLDAQYRCFFEGTKKEAVDDFNLFPIKHLSKIQIESNYLDFKKKQQRLLVKFVKGQAITQELPIV